MKKLLAIFLMMLLVFSSFPITAFASETGEADIPLEIEEDAGIPLKMEEIEPSSLQVKKLGSIEEDETLEIEEMTHQPGDIVRVSIFLDGDSVAGAGYSLDGIAYYDDAVTYRDQLKKQQDAVQRRIESTLGKDLDVRWNLTLLTNVISAEVLFSDIVRIEHVKGVKSVYIENQYSAEETSETDGTRTGHTYKDMVGAADAWEMGYTGAGTVIAIIDTGIDVEHQSFSSAAFEYSLSLLPVYPQLLTNFKINSLKTQLNAGNGAYLNTKLPFVYNYIAKNTDVSHYGLNGEHGSHVAGVAAANKYIKNGSVYENALDEIGAVGMAPDAQLLVMKVFGEDGVTYDSDYIAAMEDAIVLGADAINLSLGSATPGFTYIPEYRDAFDNLSNGTYNSKAVLSVSAGNSGAFTDHTYDLYIDDIHMHTGGSPGTYINSLCVASADNIFGITDDSGTPISRDDASISSFSSWGVPGSLLLKPEITAPGGNIYSVYGYNKIGNTVYGGHDQYTYMSGTSFAAPHISGLSSLVSQYLRDTDIFSVNPFLAKEYSLRAIEHSLLMSSATPMKKDGEYISLLQQGSGLADVSAALNGSSVIMIGDSSDTLTAKTGAASDGKVKVEFGDDPERTGLYEYDLTIYNLRDKDLFFELDTDIFTQAYHKSSGLTIMDKTTVGIDAEVLYYWDSFGYSGKQHDVDLNGITDTKDAQTILDYISGIIDDEGLDLPAGDMDEDGQLSSRDAYLLLEHIISDDNTYEDGIVPANGKRTVTVSIRLNNTEDLESVYTSGFYVEGFTYVTCDDSSEGIDRSCSHSIPLLGFYGSWTDPRMFENKSYADYLNSQINSEGYKRKAYTGNDKTNYMTLVYDNSPVIFTGNPYRNETYPSNRFAINSDTVINSITYSLIRSAGTVGFALSKIDSLGGDVTDVLYSDVQSSYVDGYWYDISGPFWRNYSPKTYTFEKSLSDYGFSEGDTIRAGFYAIPEYNVMNYYGFDSADEYTGQLDDDGFVSVLKDNVLGRGAFVGYDFTVDDTAPVIESISYNDVSHRLTVNAYDNGNIAYMAVMSLDGNRTYGQSTPKAPSITQSFSLFNEVPSDMEYVAVFAGDYAGNETAVAVKVNDNVAAREVYVQVDTSKETLVDGDVYLIGSSNVPGNIALLSQTEYNAMSNTLNKGVAATDHLPYTSGPSNYCKWTVLVTDDGYVFKKGNYYLGAYGGSPRIDSSVPVTWHLDGNAIYTDYNGAPLYLYNQGISENTVYKWKMTRTYSNAYLYHKVSIDFPTDFNTVSGVYINDADVSIYMGSEYQMTVNVTPITLEDRSVSWSSSDPSVVTVDKEGKIKGLSDGTATITAVSNADPDQWDTCTVSVFSIEKELNAFIYDENGSGYFSRFNTTSLSGWNRLHNDPVQEPIHSAFIGADSNLYAVSLDTETKASELYRVDRNNYELTDLGPMFSVTNTAAAGLTGDVISDYGGLVYVVQNIIIVGNPVAQTVDLSDGTSYTGVGIPYGMKDLSSTLKDSRIVAIALESIKSDYSNNYLLLDDQGTFWHISLTFNTSSGVFSFENLYKGYETGIRSDYLFQSIYYDSRNVYWSHYEDNRTKLYIIDPGYKKTYDAGDFDEGIWPVQGLYVDGAIAPAKAANDLLEVNLLDIKPVVSSRDELISVFFTDNSSMGHLNAMQNYVVGEEESLSHEEVIDIETSMVVTGTDADAVVIDTEYDAEGTVTVSIKEDENVTNGFVKMTYDPDILKLASYESDLLYRSVNTSVPGEIVFAYASENMIEAGTELLRLSFEPFCLDEEVTVTTLERNDALDLQELSSVTVNGCGHDWADPVYVWSLDRSSCTAVMTCSRDSSHEVRETANASFIITREATETEDGEIVYTAAFENEVFETQTRTVVIPNTSITKVRVVPYPSGGFSEGREYIIEGRTVTVDFRLACKLGYLSGEAYIPISSELTEDGYHRYLIPEDIEEVILVVKGDTSLDGDLSNYDITIAKASSLGRPVGFSEINLFAADVNCDASFSNYDITLMKGLNLGKLENSWY